METRQLFQLFLLFFGTRFGLSDSSAVCRRNVQQYSTLRTVDRRVTWLLDKRKKRPRGNFGKLLLLFFLQLFIIDFPCTYVCLGTHPATASLFITYILYKACCICSAQPKVYVLASACPRCLHPPISVFLLLKRIYTQIMDILAKVR